MIIQFITPTELSLLDITTMGSSSKRGDESKIGRFDSGLKYAIALLMRNNVKIHIETHNTDSHNSFNFEYSDVTAGNKTKKVITVVHAGKITNWFAERHQTGFAADLGFNWELWMSLRELWSNMIDEGGFVRRCDAVEKDLDALYTETVSAKSETGTIITLKFPDDCEFADVWNKRHLYINSFEPIHKLGNVDILDNPDGFLKIYKQQILVHKDPTVPSLFAYNIHFGELDERRLLLNVSDVKDSIYRTIAWTKDEGCIENMMVGYHWEIDRHEFLNSLDSYYTVSDAWAEKAYSLKDFNTFEWIRSSILKRKDCNLPGKVINTLQEGVYRAQKKITVTAIPEEVVELGFREKVLKMYNFDIKDIQVKEALMTGGTVYADKYNYWLVISKEFDLETDMGDFLVQYFDLIRESRDSIVQVLGNEFAKYLKK